MIEKHGVSDFLSVAISERITSRKRYLKRGRPGPTSLYERQAIHEYQCRSQRHEEAIDAQCDLLGWRIYVTNTPAERMSLEQSLKYYRDEWTVERGFHRFKQGCLPVLPLFIRLPERITGTDKRIDGTVIYCLTGVNADGVCGAPRVSREPGESSGTGAR